MSKVPTFVVLRAARGTFASAAMILAIAACGPRAVPLSPGEKQLPFTFHRQNGSKLCWAAGVQMVTDRPPKAGIEQCRQADAAWREKGEEAKCCTETPAKNCNFTSQPRFDQFGYRFKRRGVDGSKRCHLTWAQIRAEIDAGRPFLFDYAYSSGREAHLEAVYGYRQADGQATLMLMDPMEGDKIAWFHSYYVAGDDFTHQRDYYAVVLDIHSPGRKEVRCP